MAICFTQYLRPDGRTRPQLIDRPADIEALAGDLVRAGCSLDAEILSTHHVSFTVERIKDRDAELLAVEIVPNGPEVPPAVDRLIRTAHSRLQQEPRSTAVEEEP